ATSFSLVHPPQSFSAASLHARPRYASGPELLRSLDRAPVPSPASRKRGLAYSLAVRASPAPDRPRHSVAGEATRWPPRAQHSPDWPRVWSSPWSPRPLPTRNAPPATRHRARSLLGILSRTPTESSG